MITSVTAGCRPCRSRSVERPPAPASPRCRLDHGVAAQPQRARGERAHRRPRPRPAARRPRPVRSRGAPRLGLGRRRRLDPVVGGQIDGEDRALARRAVGEDEAAGLLDDAVGGGQAEAGALADLLGGEERLEDLVELALGDAGAAVRDLDRRRSRPAASSRGRGAGRLVQRQVARRRCAPRRRAASRRGR